MRSERRPIGSDVMREGLSKARPPCRYCAQGRRIVLRVAAVTEPAGSTERVQERFVRGERRKVGKESCVRGRGDGAVNAPRARRRETVRMFHIDILAPPSRQ